MNFVGFFEYVKINVDGSVQLSEQVDDSSEVNHKNFVNFFKNAKLESDGSVKVVVKI